MYSSIPHCRSSVVSSLESHYDRIGVKWLFRVQLVDFDKALVGPLWRSMPIFVTVDGADDGAADEI